VIIQSPVGVSGESFPGRPTTKTILDLGGYSIAETTSYCHLAIARVPHAIGFPVGYAARRPIATVGDRWSGRTSEVRSLPANESAERPTSPPHFAGLPYAHKYASPIKGLWENGISDASFPPVKPGGSSSG
jgi:hypothetical protein